MGEVRVDLDHLLPKRALAYVRDTGVRAIDRLAGTFESAESHHGASEGTAALRGGARLVEHWRTMTPEEKGTFVERVALSIVEVIVVAAVVPTGLKLGKRAAKATGKVLGKKAKKLRKGVQPDEKKKKKKKKV